MCDTCRSADQSVGTSNFSVITPPRWGVEYCDQLVCLSVCLSASISLELLDRSQELFYADPLWSWLDTLRTCGFVDDITFGRCETGAQSDVYELIVKCCLHYCHSGIGANVASFKSLKQNCFSPGKPWNSVFLAL